MPETKKIFDIEPKSSPQKTAGKAFLWLAVFVVAAGLVTAGILARGRLFGDTERHDQVLGEELEIGGQENENQASGQDIEVSPDDVEPNAGQQANPPASQPKQQAVKPQPQPAAPDPICSSALSGLNQVKASAQNEYNISAAEAQSIYELEVQEANANLALLQGERNSVINTYYAAIEQATNKYNASGETEADYNIYQQEQAAALGVYNSGIAGIAQKEQAWQEQIQDAASRRTLRLNQAAGVRDEKLVVAENQYQQQTAGKNCTN